MESGHLGFKSQLAFLLGCVSTSQSFDPVGPPSTSLLERDGANYLRMVLLIPSVPDSGGPETWPFESHFFTSFPCGRPQTMALGLPGDQMSYDQMLPNWTVK